MNKFCNPKFKKEVFHMNAEAFQELVKNKLDDIKENTLSQLLEEDKAYQNSRMKHNLAEKDYIKLALSQAQRDVIDRLLTYADENKSV